MNINPLPYLITSLPETTSILHSSMISTTYKEAKFDPISRENTLSNLQVIDTKEGSKDVKQSLFLEQLARALAYHMDESTKELILPLNGRKVCYQVETLPLATGMLAYGLTPTDEGLPPILLFRGSAMYPSGRGALATVATDLDPLGVGFTTYNLSSKKITSWLEKQNQKVLVTGHSLGGAFAIYAACDNSDKVAAVEIHSTPGVSVFAKRKWESLKNPGFDIKHYYHPKDELIHFGQERIGKQYKVEISQEDLFPQIPEYERSGWRSKSIFHRVSLLDRHASCVEETPQSTLNPWQERAVTTIPCIAAYLLLGITRLLFGTAQHPMRSLLGPIRLIIRRAIHTIDANQNLTKENALNVPSSNKARTL